MCERLLCIANRKKDKGLSNFALPLGFHFPIVIGMVLFVIVMVAVALLAAVGYLVSNRTPSAPRPTIIPAPSLKPVAQPAPPAPAPAPTPPQPPPQPAPQRPQTMAATEDVVTYIPAEIPAILHDVLSSVPLATVEEAMMGCYGTMGATAHNSEVRPYQTKSLDEVLVRTSDAIASMETEQHISKFTISTHKKSKTNPHVDLFAHSTEPKRIRLIRFWRTQETFITTLPE